ncbi:type II toxin-antitoxin system VapC family toxin [Allokutzneria albata]|uniref:Ribonuclease VapC n=1 Tax=Allokutzneria albata TaxID=211114 RepID=A0A1H0CC72_ALLAB|nr:PIN domain-containing protein [Allokutzneria albata]SDN55459.1 hypothetical protein SAMN04489726_7141 [Allokutzneria albata]
MIVVDTGPLYAAMDADDQDHERCARLLTTVPGPLIVPAPVLTEVCYLLESRCGGGAEAVFLRALCSGELSLEPLELRDLERMAELVTKYADMPLGAVDASVVAVAERLGASTVATLDRRHFTVVRPNHIPAFTLLP